MKITVTETMFYDAFQRHRPNSFSYEGLSILFEYLVDREMQEEMELDVIAICCEWNEMSLDYFVENYEVEGILSKHNESEYLKDVIIEYLYQKTTIAGFTDDSVVFACF